MTMFPSIIGSFRGPMEPYLPMVRQHIAEGISARYRKALFPRWIIPLRWTLLSPAEKKQIDDFVISVAGAGLTFEWTDWFSFAWTDVTICANTGSGGESTLAIPGIASSAQSFFNTAGSLAGAVSPGTGDDGRDEVTFGGPSTAAIWMHATMKRIFTVRFENDVQPFPVDLETGYYDFECRLVVVK